MNKPFIYLSVIKFLKSIFNFRHQKKQLLHIVLISYLAAFCLARAWSLFVGSSVYIRGFQIHHFYFGTLTLAVGGLLGLLSEKKDNLRFASVLIGVGLGLFADEIGLLLNCTTKNHACLYAFPDTGDIITTITVAILLLLIIVDINEKREWKKQTADKI